MMTNLQIRQATIDDVDVITEYNIRMAQETENIQLEYCRVKKGVEAVLRDPSKGTYIVAEINGIVIGQLLRTFEWSDWRNGMFWWIQSVYVLPEYRRKGIFRALYSYLENIARTTEGVCGLRLYVEQSNTAAIQTYTAQGMRLTHYKIMEIDFVVGRNTL